MVGRQEVIAQFGTYLDYLSQQEHRICPSSSDNDNNMEINDDDDHGSQDGDDATSVHFLLVKLGTTLRKADNFTAALKTFI